MEEIAQAFSQLVLLIGDSVTECNFEQRDDINQILVTQFKYFSDITEMYENALIAEKRSKNSKIDRDKNLTALAELISEVTM